MPLSRSKCSTASRIADRRLLGLTSAGCMLRTNDAQFRHLGAPEVLQLHQLPHRRVAIALQQFADDLQAHLEADEALQRTIVKIGRDPLPL